MASLVSGRWTQTTKSRLMEVLIVGLGVDLCDLFPLTICNQLLSNLDRLGKGYLIIMVDDTLNNAETYRM